MHVNILALETSTEACSAALLTAEGTLFSEFDLAPRQHTAVLPVMLERVLQRADLDRNDIDYIAFTNGPGAFTGVRIAAAMAQGIAMGLDVPLVPISTLVALAQQASQQLAVKDIVAALDARMGEVYVGAYQRDDASGLVSPTGEETLIKLAELSIPRGYCGVGSGFIAQHEAGLELPSGAQIDEPVYPTAEALVGLAARSIRMGRFEPAEAIQINYLRNRVAEKKPQR